MLLSEAVDPGPNQKVSLWSYVTNPNANGFGYLASKIEPDGHWTAYQYDDQHRVSREWTPWLDEPLTTNPLKAKVKHFDYQFPENQIDTGFEPIMPQVM